MGSDIRVRSSFKAVIWLYIFNGIASIMPFIIRTLIIRYWGMEYLGLNSLFSSILSVLNIGELGIGSALMVGLYKPTAENDLKKINALLSLYNFLYKLIGIFILIFGICLLPFLTKLVNGDYPDNINIYIIFCMYLTQTLSSYWICSYARAAFQANQQLHTIYKNESLIWGCNYAIQIAVIVFCHSYYVYVFFLPVGTVLCGLINGWAMRKYFPTYKVHNIKYSDFTSSFWSDFVKRVLAMSLSKVREVFRNSLDVLVLSSVVGLVIVAEYQNYMLVMTVPFILLTSVMNGILPSLGNSIATESKESNYETVKLIAFIVHWIATVFTVFLACFYQPFMRIWAGEENLLSGICVILFCIYFYLRSLCQISIIVRNASGLWWEGKWIAIIESVFNLGMNIIFVHIWGVEGIVLATILSLVLINIPFETFYVYKYYFNKKPWADLWKYIVEAIICLVIVVISYFVINLNPINSVGTFIVNILLCAILPNVLLIIIYMRDSRFRRLKKILLGLISR